MTGWSWKLGLVAGIDVYMHGTFLILLAWVGVSHYLQRHHLADAGGSGERTDADRRGHARRGGHDIAFRLRGTFGDARGAVQRLRASDCRAQPVLRDRELVGVLR